MRAVGGRVSSARSAAERPLATTSLGADFVAPAWGDPIKICRLLQSEMATLKFDQLIFEVGWVHISFNSRRRKQVLNAHFVDGRVNYTQGLA